MFEPFLATSVVSALQDFVTVTKLHPILVDFTAALVPVSIITDLAARWRKQENLRYAAWLTLLYATVITPFTAITGWLFWMSDDDGVAGMTVHKWLGSSLAVVLIALFLWRNRSHRRAAWPTAAYYILGLVFVVLLIVQGSLGGAQTFSEM